MGVVRTKKNCTGDIGKKHNMLFLDCEPESALKVTWHAGDDEKTNNPLPGISEQDRK